MHGLRTHLIYHKHKRKLLPQQVHVPSLKRVLAGPILSSRNRRVDYLDMLSTPVFTPVTPPRIKLFYLNSVNIFLREYESYTDLIRERRSVHGEHISPNSVRSCIAKDEFNGLALFISIQNPNQISDDYLLGSLKTIRSQATSSPSINIDKLITDRVVMNMSIRSVEDRVLSF